MPRHEDLREQFITQLRERLQAGEIEYGDVSFDRPLVEVIGEMQEEVLDIAGWGFVAFVRLEQLKRLAQEVLDDA
jgi:class 3 adenylate cyclase